MFNRNGTMRIDLDYITGLILGSCVIASASVFILGTLGGVLCLILKMVGIAE